MKKDKSIRGQVREEFPEFASECDALSAPALSDRLAQNAKDSQAVDEAKEADDDYQAAKQVAKDLGAPYRDAKKALKLKAKYLIELSREKESHEAHS